MTTDPVNRWKTILEYTSNNIEKLDESQYSLVAYELEKHESKIMNDARNYNIPNDVVKCYATHIIPSIRIMEGPLECINIKGNEYFKVFKYNTANECDRLAFHKDLLTFNYSCGFGTYNTYKCVDLYDTWVNYQLVF